MRHLKAPLKIYKMADFSLQLQADNLPISVINELFVEGPWKPVMNRMLTAENILLEGCRGVGKTMLMRAASQRLQTEYQNGGKILGVHTTFKRYLATLPPPASGNGNENNIDLANFRAWINARILGAVVETLKNLNNDKFPNGLEDLGRIKWDEVVSILETTYRGSTDLGLLLENTGLERHAISALQGYTYTSNILKKVVKVLNLDLLILFLDDAAHALDTRAQGAFFTAIKSLYDAGLAFKISVYPAVTRYGIDFSYGHDATVVSLGIAPKVDGAQSFRDVLARRQKHADAQGQELLRAILANESWTDLLYL